jgi:hypothetical protein
MSLDQLEEVRCRIFLFGGHLKVRDPGGMLLANVERAVNRPYMLELNIGAAYLSGGARYQRGMEVACKVQTSELLWSQGTCKWEHG